MTEYAEIRARIESQRRVLEQRLGRIRSDRRREQGPLDADSKEQVIELENAPVLDALDRLDDGRFGRCASCGGRVSLARLRAVPTATRCRSCAS